jgi:uncharacterized membrane protein
MEPYLIEWGATLLRWLHVVAAMAWIGSSFFFMHLDASLKAAPDIPAEQGAAAWQVHGGGFYEMRKYFVAPAALPKLLTWHKWQSYWTWISGFSLLVWIYYGQSQLYLIDPSVRVLSPLEAAAIGVGALAVGWIIYDGLCRALVGKHDALLTALVYLLVVGASFGFASVFSGRGALIHTGAFMATLMTGNVFFNIIPNQKKVVADLIAGRTPNPEYGKHAKQRSDHNNYLTLPVIFFMLSNHAPTTFANSATLPALVALVVLTGGVIRYFYNRRHRSRSDSPWWAWAAAALAMWAAFWIAMAASPSGRQRLGLAPLPPPKISVAYRNPPQEVVAIVETRCAVCHSSNPAWSGVQIAPKNVRLDTPQNIAREAAAILQQAVLAQTMPPNNVTDITPGERGELAAWLMPQTFRARAER